MRGRETARSSRRWRRLAVAWIGLVVLVSVIDPTLVFEAVPDPTNGPTHAEPGGLTQSLLGLLAGIDVFVVSHVVAYGVLAWLLAAGLDMDAESESGGRARLLFAVVTATAVGLGVELIQAPLAVRTASAADAGVNGIGAIAGVCVRAVVRAVRCPSR